MNKLKIIWWKIRLYYHDLVTYQIPERWEKIKESFQEDPLKSWMYTLTVFIAIPLAIYSGVNYYRYNHGLKLQKELAAKQAAEQEKRSGIMNIVKDGPEKYLEQQLSKKNKSEVLAMFNNSVKWHGKYDEVISKTTGFKKNAQYQNYLNPIIQDLQSGQTLQAQQTGIKFSNKQVDITSNDGVLGVMLILIDSKNPNEIKQALEYQTENRDYTVYIYNKDTPSGYSLFDWPRQTYLFGGDGERIGFGPNNDWNGKIYAFNNSRWVYRNRTLPKTLPTKLSNKAFNAKDEKNTTKVITTGNGSYFSGINTDNISN